MVFLARVIIVNLDIFNKLEWRPKAYVSTHRYNEIAPVES